MSRRVALALVVGGLWSFGCTQLIGANWDQELRSLPDVTLDGPIHPSDAAHDAGDATASDTGVDTGADRGPIPLKCSFLEGGGGDYCSCFYAPDGGLFGASNDASCAAQDLTDPGACCAAPGLDFLPECTCQSFLCYPQPAFFGGGFTCSYGSPGNNTLTDAAPTHSASGKACCVSLGGDSSVTTCDCYDAADACAGFKPVSMCTPATTPFCSSFDTFGYTSVKSCR